MDIEELNSLSNQELLSLLEILVTVINVRSYLSDLTEECQFNIEITQKERSENV